MGNYTDPLEVLYIKDFKAKFVLSSKLTGFGCKDFEYVALFSSGYSVVRAYSYLFIYSFHFYVIKQTILIKNLL